MVSFTLNGCRGHGRRRRTRISSRRCARSWACCSPKDGCSPSGQCGCCTVLVDGKAVVSCNLSLREGRGRDDHDARRLARRASATAWRRRSRPPARCSAASARRASSCASRRCSRSKGADLDRDTAARHLGAHLCRCTGYVKILDAVELLAKGETPRARAARRHRHERHAATRASTSRSATSRTSTTCASDGMLHGAVQLADHARADVLRIDTTRRGRGARCRARVHRGRRARRSCASA